MTEKGRVCFNGKTIEYEVLRSVRRKKTVQITLEGSRVRVAAPKATPKGEIQQIVLKKASWIDRGLSEATPAETPRQFVSGETLPYLGREVPLVVQASDVQSPGVRLGQKGFLVVAPCSGSEEEHASGVRQALVDWYRERAAEHIGAGITKWRARLWNGDEPRVLIRDQRRRWGSCAADGTLRFNWRLVMLERPLLEYVVVHELAHLTVMNHSSDFWDVVAGALPDVKLRRRRLRETGRGLPL